MVGSISRKNTLKYRGQFADLSEFAGKSKRDSLPPVGRNDNVDQNALKLRLA